MKGPIRIAHISDLHFSKICLNPLQIFSKRLLGNANLLLKRGRIYLNDKPFSLPDFFEKKKITDIFITGDFTTTSQKSEYHLARKLIDEFRKKNFRVVMIPGNHDHYTKGAVKRRAFYEEIPQPVPENAIKMDRVSAFPLTSYYWVVTLDTTMYTPFIDATGDFSESIEANLRGILKKIPNDAKILMLNHFPFFCNDSYKRRLIGGKRLEGLLRETPNILFYLHGHTHRRVIADLRGDQLPIVLDSGSTSHATHGSWNLLELDEKSAKIEVFESTCRHGTNWNCVQEEKFSL
ncbi:MAG: metallophosphoesterase [Candidatus Algichlamydia australiensis]|nr:metallophosphoesterase [Chlamydiales bacterium]